MDHDLVNVVGYGTFITKNIWKSKSKVEVCLVEDYIRIFPRDSWFPYALPKKNSSFWALKFSVTKSELHQLDGYEGISEGLFKRKSINVSLKNNEKIQVEIYLPTKDTIETQDLDPCMDLKDRWKKEIKNHPEIVSKFPELIL